MPDTELEVQFPEEKLDALRYFTEKDGTTVEDELKNHLDKFYQKNVPLQVRKYIEKKAGLGPEPEESSSSPAPEQQDRQQRQGRRHSHLQAVPEPPAAPQSEQEESAEAEGQGMTMGGM